MNKKNLSSLESNDKDTKYLNKYLKYKNKYIEKIKKLQKGGEKKDKSDLVSGLYDSDVKLFKQNYENKLPNKIVRDSLGEMHVPNDKYWGWCYSKIFKIL